MGTHPLRVEVWMLDVFYHRFYLPFFLGLVVAIVVAVASIAPPLGLGERGHHWQGLLADDAHVPEVTSEALMMHEMIHLVVVFVVVFVVHAVIRHLSPFFTARQLGTAECLTSGIDRGVAVQTHEAVDVIIAMLLSAMAYKVYVALAPQNQTSARVARPRGSG